MDSPRFLPLTQENFALFGTLVGPPGTPPQVAEPCQSYWHGLLPEDLQGQLRLGFLQIRSQPLVFDTLERHPRSGEVFIQTGGRGVMPFAPATAGPAPREEDIVFFVLDGAPPFLVRQNVWHAPALPLGESINFLMALPAGILQDVEKCAIRPLPAAPP